MKLVISAGAAGVRLDRCALFLSFRHHDKSPFGLCQNGERMLAVPTSRSFPKSRVDGIRDRYRCRSRSFGRMAVVQLLLASLLRPCDDGNGWGPPPALKCILELFTKRNSESLSAPRLVDPVARPPVPACPACRDFFRPIAAQPGTHYPTARSPLKFRGNFVRGGVVLL